MNDEQKRREDLKAIKEKVEASMAGRTGQGSDDEHSFGNDANDQKKEKISKDLWMKRMEAEASAREAKREQEELYEQEKFHREDEARDARWNEADAHMVDEDELKEKFEDEYPELWTKYNQDPDFNEKMNVALNLEIAAGADPMDFRIYQRVGEKFNERLRKMEENPDAAAREFEREDAINMIAHRNVRQIDRDNVYANASFRSDEPAAPEAIQEAFVNDYEDVVRDPKAYQEAESVVDDVIHEEGEAAGSVYSTYQAAGDVARNRNALRDMAKGRGQDPDTV